MNKTAAPKNAVYKPGANYKVTMPGNKSHERDDIFSKSRDNREDRGSRQMKTSHAPQTLPHGH